MCFFSARPGGFCAKYLVALDFVALWTKSVSSDTQGFPGKYQQTWCVQSFHLVAIGLALKVSGHRSSDFPMSEGPQWVEGTQWLLAGSVGSGGITHRFLTYPPPPSPPTKRNQQNASQLNRSVFLEPAFTTFVDKALDGLLTWGQHQLMVAPVLRKKPGGDSLKILKYPQCFVVSVLRATWRSTGCSCSRDGRRRRGVIGL